MYLKLTACGFVCKMSNALDANGLWTARVEDKFIERVRILDCSEPFFLTESGVPIGAERKSKLKRLIRRALSKTCPQIRFWTCLSRRFWTWLGLMQEWVLIFFV